MSNVAYIIEIIINMDNIKMVGKTSRLIWVNFLVKIHPQMNFTNIPPKKDTANPMIPI